MPAPGTSTEPRAASRDQLPPKPRFRGWLHVGAFAVVLVAGPVLISQARTPSERWALAIYVAALLGLFGVSSLFHRVRWGPVGARRMRRADHCTIFVAIAGTYTAVAMLALHGSARAFILALVWGGSAVGILIRQVLLDAPKWMVALPYVVVGWSAVAVIPELVRAMSWPGFALVAVGGIAYTAGAVVYARRRPDPMPGTFGFHEVFHSCTVIGATLHFVAIAWFALPRA